jgi:hypothetical protein
MRKTSPESKKHMETIPLLIYSLLHKSKTFHLLQVTNGSNPLPKKGLLKKPE